ncbi:MAG: translation elongation factor Ts [Bacillota bacterium]|nr:translation elongation factor Ts [Bacillota bacterium]MDD6979045.1 translation elongation factor Ts [Bacillota bacterium]MDD7130781.1 translation elongation factor Ts [Bacillota bacterium]MDO4473000.1 translation elongation factor Ts [Bacillota bacterium]MDY6173876.1 translation elongation factor Ts [Lentihominibacter sp.]
MAVTAKMVKELREMTGAGMMDCKKALVETDGDIDAAVEVLREKGLSKAAKKAGRIAAMGLVKTAFSEDGKTAAIVEVNSETDFVAKNDEFINFVEGLAKLALTAENNDMEAFKAMPYEGATVGEALTALIAKIGENMSVRRIEKVSGEVLASYIHGGGNIGVIIAADGADNDDNKTALKNIAMQVAAMNPQYVSRDEISDEELANLKKITLESALNDPFTLPKPILNGLLDKAVDGVWSAEDTAILAEKRADKGFNFNYLPNFLSEEAKTQLASLAVADKAEISENKIFKGLVEGRISKQLKEICLLDQTYVRAEDGKQTVSQYLGSVDKGLSLAKVVRFEVGEGIEKKEEDFAAEVAAQLNK